MSRSQSSRVTVEDKILLHLKDFSRFREQYVVPVAVTQIGISNAVGITRNHLPRAVKKMKESGFVIEKKAHVEGIKNRRKVYFLSNQGIMQAQRIKESMRVREYIDFADQIPKPKYFFGREREIEALNRTLEKKGSSMILLKGMAGIGKTALISKVITKKKFREKIFWYRCSEGSSLRGVLSRLSGILKGMNKDILELYLESRKNIDIKDIYNILKSELKETGLILIFDDVHKARIDMIPMFNTIFQILKDVDGIKTVFIGREIPPFFDKDSDAAGRIIFEMSLEGLDKESGKKLLSIKGVPKKRIDGIFRSTRGHPLILELIRTDVKDIHYNLEKFIGNEIFEELSEEEKKLLGRASVYRFPVHYNALFFDESLSIEILGRLREKSLVSVSRYLVDVHDIIREFMYSNMNVKYKTRCHIEAGKYYLEGKDELASIEAQYHFLRAGNTEKVAKIAVEKGEEIIRKGHLEEFLSVLNEFKRENMDERMSAELSVLVGDILVIRGKWEEAEKEYSKALEKYKRMKRKVKIAEINRKMGNLSDIKGDYKTALSYYETGLGILGKRKGIEASKIYDEIGDIYLKTGEYDKAEEYISKANSIAEKLNDEKERALSYHSLGNVNLCKENWDEALKFYTKSQKKLEELGHTQMLAVCYNNIGIIHYKNWNLDSAIKFWEKSLWIGERSGDMNIVLSYNNLGSACLIKGDWDKAVEYCNKSLEISEKVGYRFVISSSYTNLGQVYLGRGEQEKALEYFKKALAIREDTGEQKGISASYGDLAKLHISKGQFKRAKEFCNKSLAIAEKIDYKEGTAAVYALLGEIALKKGEIDEAIKQCKRSLALSKKHGKLKEEGISLRTLGAAYGKKESGKAMEDQFKKSMEIFERINNPYELAKSYFEYGKSLIDKTDKGDDKKDGKNNKKAEKYLARSLKIFEGLKAKSDIEKVREIGIL